MPDEGISKSFRFFRSLKFRIVATIFLLELLMLSVVLWQTQSVSLANSEKELEKSDHVIIELLSEVSHTALLTTEFDILQPYFLRAAENPHVELVFLSDHRELIVASSDIRLIGVSNNDISATEDFYWRHKQLENASGSIGTLHIRFSARELNAAFNDSLYLGIYLAISGMLLIAIASAFMGTLLTRRLDKLAEHASLIASGNLDHRIDISGKDEIADLARTLNSMTQQVSQSFSKMEHMAYHDGLTGLANRHELHKRLNSMLKSAKRHNHQHALLFLDLDQFKVVNDTCGHDAGDALLTSLAEVLASQLRARDTVARLGGDEFGILLENCDDEEALLTAEKIRKAVEQFRFDWHGKSFSVGVSTGVVPITSQSGNLKRILSTADMACYTAKDRGRNTIHLAKENDEAVSLRVDEMNWVPRLHAALEEERLVLFYQEIAPTQSPDERPFIEYLVRLKDLDDKLIVPSVFLTAAERFGLITQIDRRVLRMVLNHLSTAGMPPELAFINLSAKSVMDESFYRYVKREINDSGINPSMICFEITETVAIDNFDAATNFISKIRKLGCKFALDDFGSGMCSFTYLKRLNVDFVKVDGSFVLNMLENSVDESIISAINQIAHDAGFLSIGEFVETESHLERLQEIGLDYVQGYAIHTHEQLELAPA